MKNKIIEPALPASVTAHDNYSYKERELRAPPMSKDEVIIFDEPGRILPRSATHSGGTDCRSHYFRVSKPEYGFYRLSVRHGGGDESWDLDYDKRSIEALSVLGSDARYRLLWVIMDAHHEGERRGRDETALFWKKAAAEKRIKTRKMPNSPAVKVWIVPEEKK